MFVDRWDRADGTLGNGWIDAHDAMPAWWDQVHLLHGSPVITDPDRGKVMQTDNSGARAAFYRDFGPDGDTQISVSINWNGVYPYECSPLLHVNPGEPDFGIGAWYVTQWFVFLVATVGRRPDELRLLARVPFDHTYGISRRIELRSTGRWMTIWTSLIEAGQPLEQVGPEFAIPSRLQGSTMHGVAVDINQDPKRPANQPVVLPPFIFDDRAERVGGT